MDQESDPIHNFFTTMEANDPHILYDALEVLSTATAEEIKKAYRKAALRYHPDRHVHRTPDEKEDLDRAFKKVGFAWAVLSDQEKRKRYDATGRTNDIPFGDAEAMGWDTYFQTMYQRLDRKILDDDKKKYQGSKEELTDLKTTYLLTNGSLPKILDHIPHSTVTDEERFITLINEFITNHELTSTKLWEKTSKDDKAREKRLKASKKAEKQAEEAARELGIWDEFYGDGKKGARMGDDAKGKTEKTEGDEGDGLGALILKRQRDREGGLNALEDKYRRLEEEKARKKAKKGGKKGVVEEEVGDMPEISDADFEALQAKLFAKKDNAEKEPKKAGRKGKA